MASSFETPERRWVGRSRADGAQTQPTAHNYTLICEEPEILDRLVEGVQRMMRAECTAARSPHEPEFELFHRFPMTDNDLMATARVREAFVAQFGAERAEHMEPVTASEDFSAIPDAFGAPYCYWGLGGYVEGRETAPNHSPFFAPDPQPTLRTGTEAAASAALAWLGTTG